ncbi:YtxH domain-containing protein [Alkalicoccus daliensis]|uniref:Gas vesicle protein n=1 Tax=Alkalicoccus daliensis TaxID=745820 RepID=A0A1H0C8K6_9BACI|nr:YtxH domain-containing protein [Alkalicoccus daliensis]SDN54218.1 Gas vesicle protein [Alkalicoccus daliensis]
MSEESVMNTKDFFIGALIGGLVGASTAFLVTPKSGREIREGINEQARESTTSLVDKMKDLSRSMRKDMKELTDSADYLIEDFDDLSEDIAASVRQEVEDLQRSVEQLIREVEEREKAKKNGEGRV